MTIGKLKNLINKSDNPTLEPLRNMFALMDHINDEYKKENNGKESPYYNDSIELNRR